MNNKILLLALGVVLFTSCTTAYKAGQTPDDVYFSPVKEQDNYVQVESRQEREGNLQRYSNSSNYNYDNYRDNRFLRMSIGNRNRWSNYNNYNMYDNYYNRNDYSLYSPWNNYYYWNNFYNPYTRYSLFNPGYYGNGYYNPGYSGGVGYSTKIPVTTTSRPGAFNPNSYSNNTYSNNNLSMDRKLGNRNGNQPAVSSSNTGTRYSSSGYNNSNRNSNYNNSYNNTYSNQRSSNNNNNSYSQPGRSMDAPVRSYTPSASSGSSGGGSRGSSGSSMSRPTRGGN